MVNNGSGAPTSLRSPKNGPMILNAPARVALVGLAGTSIASDQNR